MESNLKIGKVSRTATLPTMEIEGGQYSKVAERIKFLANNFVYEIQTSEEFFADVKMWKVKATLTIHEDGRSLKYTGTATEKIGSNEVNLTSALENCETSAVGRACAMAGIGVTDNVGSADETEGVGRKKEVAVDDKLVEKKQATKNAEKDVLNKLNSKK